MQAALNPAAVLLLGFPARGASSDIVEDDNFRVVNGPGPYATSATPADSGSTRRDAPAYKEVAGPQSLRGTYHQSGEPRDRLFGYADW